MGTISKKDTKKLNPSKNINSSCLKQCETKHPKKKIYCKQRCFDKGAPERQKMNKNVNHSSKNTTKPNSTKKPKNFRKKTNPFKETTPTRNNRKRQNPIKYATNKTRDKEETNNSSSSCIRQCETVRSQKKADCKQ